MVAPGMNYDYKPPKESRWQRFWDWVRYDVSWDDIGAVLWTLVIVGLFGFVGWLIFKPDPRDAITSGIVVDKGTIRPGKTKDWYSYWVEVESNEVKVTWEISDTYYERVSIGDYVEKGKLPEEDDGK